MSALFFRHAFSDYQSLREVEQGTIPEPRTLRRRLFVLERRLDSRRPDHFYHSYLEQRFSEARSIGKIPSVVHHAMADRFLEVRPGGVFVRTEAFGEWQTAIGLLSPLALASYALGQANPPTSRVNMIAFVQGRVGPTACKAPFIPALDDLIASDGLHDLHMHLNGSTEIDLVWEDAVRRPDVYRAEFDAPYLEHEAVRELYDQIEDGLTTNQVCRRLKAARRARHLVARALRQIALRRSETLAMASLLEAIAIDTDDSDFDLPGVALTDHPYETIVGVRCDLSPLEKEAAFLLSCFDAMRSLPSHAEAIGLMLWHSLTVFSQVARLAVHQFDQSGFHQFNKAVQSGVREELERSYAARFGQLNGRARGGDLTYIDGRFAPKKTPAKTAALLESVVDGLLDYRGCPQRIRGRNLPGSPPPCLSGPCGCPNRTDRLDLALVAHFIKKPDDQSSRDFLSDDGPPGRHLSLRTSLAEQAMALRHVLDHSAVARSLVRGLDGAGNELDAPPEVFAPTFRFLRASGLTRGATYHVGEDFLHLTSGIRSVEEAIRFLGLGAGDRVGHAIALGVEPAFWIERVSDRVLVPKDQVLDDAVYTLMALREQGVTTGDEAGLTHCIETIGRDLYGEGVAASELERAWALRRLDVAEVIDLERSHDSEARRLFSDFADHARRKADECLDDRRAAERRAIAVAAHADPVAFRLFRRRHDYDFMRRGLCPVEIAVSARGSRATYSLDTLHALQAHGISVLNAAQVVIESMPTSNVRINAYRSYDEHHLLRWLGLGGTPLLVRPTVCLGSDDPGIFTTNARNEFSHVYIALSGQTSSTEAIQALRTLNLNGRTHRFQAPT